jgi:HEPN domain-containing protein
MDTTAVKEYWIEEALEALQVARHLFEKEDYSYSLFFGHLAVEKLLKAVYVFRKKEHAPYGHNLKRLADLAGVELTESRSDQLLRITTYNLESRYPDEKRALRIKCTEDLRNPSFQQSRRYSVG